MQFCGQIRRMGTCPREIIPRRSAGQAETARPGSRCYPAKHFSIRTVAASTQNQALSAILFLYHEVLKQEIEWLDQVDHVHNKPGLGVRSPLD